MILNLAANEYRDPVVESKCLILFEITIYSNCINNNSIDILFIDHLDYNSLNVIGSQWFTQLN